MHLRIESFPVASKHARCMAQSYIWTPVGFIGGTGVSIVNDFRSQNLVLQL